MTGEHFVSAVESYCDLIHLFALIFDEILFPSVKLRFYSLNVEMRHRNDGFDVNSSVTK